MGAPLPGFASAAQPWQTRRRKNLHHHANAGFVPHFCCFAHQRFDALRPEYAGDREDVDMIGREVSVKRSKGNTAGVRKIPLNAGAMWAFARLIERARALGANAPEHYVLPRFKYRSKTPGHGTGYDPTRPQKTWRTAWRALVKETGRRAGRKAAEQAIGSGLGFRAGIAAWRRAAAPFRGLRFHDLRHLAVTKLAESEAPDATIMAIAGHMSREMMEHYSHVRAAMKRKAVDAIPSYIPADETPATINKSVQ